MKLYLLKLLSLFFIVKFIRICLFDILAKLFLENPERFRENSPGGWIIATGIRILFAPTNFVCLACVLCAQIPLAIRMWSQSGLGALVTLHSEVCSVCLVQDIWMWLLSAALSCWVFDVGGEDIKLLRLWKVACSCSCSGLVGVFISLIVTWAAITDALQTLNTNMQLTKCNGN